MVGPIYLCIFAKKYDKMTEGYHVKEYGQPVKRYVQTMDLKDDPELIADRKSVV